MNPFPQTYQTRDFGPPLAGDFEGFEPPPIPPPMPPPPPRPPPREDDPKPEEPEVELFAAVDPFAPFQLFKWILRLSGLKVRPHPSHLDRLFLL